MTRDLVPLADLCHVDRRHVRPDDADASGLPFVGVEHVIAGSVRIPAQPDHRIRRKPITDSDSTRSLIPAEAGHRFRCQADHFSAMTGIVHGVRPEGARGAG